MAKHALAGPREEPWQYSETPHHVASHTAEQHTLRPLATKAAGLFLGAAVGAGIGNTAFPTHDHIGPIELSVGLRPSNTIELSDGVLPGARSKSPLPFLGAKVSINKLNINPNTVFNKKSQASGSEAATYIQSFSDVPHDIHRIARHVAIHTAEWAGGGAAVTGAGMAGIFLYRRRLDSSKPEVAQAIRTLGDHYNLQRYRLPLAAALVVSGCAASYSAVDYHNVKPTAAFSGTPLAGIQLTGELAKPTEGALNSLQLMIQQNNDYYKQPVQELNTLFTADYAASLPSGANIAAVAVISDKHCHDGMDPFIANIVKKFKADLLVSGGDDDISGTNFVEFLCTKGLAGRMSEQHVPFIAAIGNHDSSTTTDPKQTFNTERWELSEGIHVLDDPNAGSPDKPKPVMTFTTKHGNITVASIRDPRRSRIGHKISPLDPNLQRTLLTAQASRIGQLACQQPGPVDIAIAHDPTVAQLALSAGCNKISLGLSGHVHHRIMPEQYGKAADGSPAYLYTEGTSGGAGDTPSYGPLQNEADMSVAYFDTTTHTYIGSVYISVLPTSDAQLVMSNFTPVPGPHPTIKEPIALHR